MNKVPLLTIAIPTYNRAAQLDAQLHHLFQMLENHWNECQLMVSDNASTDSTAIVCQTWQERGGGRLTVATQPTNLGLVGNVSYCLREAVGRYVWVVGDDDTIRVDALEVLLNTLKTYPETGLVHLNHRCISGIDGSSVHDRFYPWQEDQVTPVGRALAEACITHREGGLMFITAAVIRKDLALRAMATWPEGIHNLAYPLYLNSHAASDNPMVLLAAPLCDSLYFVSSWSDRHLELELHDVPEVYQQLIKVGYDPILMGRLIGRRLQGGRLRGLARLLLKKPQRLHVVLRSYQLARQARKAAE